MHKVASAALFLWVAVPALGCGASSDAGGADEAGDTQSQSGDRTGGQNSAQAGGSGQASDDADPDQGAEVEPDLSAPPDVAAPPSDATFTSSGLASRVLVEGDGTRRPIATDRVRVNYSGWQTNGMLFDSSLRRGMPSEFALDRVIDGWTEGLQLMVEGEQRRFWIPEELAYAGSPDRPQGMLVFDVELIAILTP